ncbi:MAG: DUF6120 family protein [Oscillospiraceae bacterium]|nr:DUF6120 family protein [Oscillospiraceae bacterium]
MRVTQQERKQYLNQIKKLLVCKGSQRKKFLNSFADNMDEYLKDNPDADFAKLQEDMGTPQEIANAFLENEDASKIKKRMSFKKWIILGIVGVLIIAVVFFVCAFIDSYKSNRGSFNDTITESQIHEDAIVEEIVSEK